MNSGGPCIAAALATIEVLERDQVHPRLFALGQSLMIGLRQAALETGHSLLIQGLGPLFHVGFTGSEQVRDFRDAFAYDKPKYARFVAAMQERGIRLIGRGLWYLSAAHTEAEITQAIETARQVLREMEP